MHNCQSLDPLVTPFVDGELADTERRAVEEHLQKCPPCHTRVAAERAVHDLLRARKPTLCKVEAPGALFARCSRLAARNDGARGEDARHKTQDGRPQHGVEPARRINEIAEPRTLHAEPVTVPAPRFPSRVAPYALAASLALVVGGAFVYQATDRSARVLAAELVADHAKCFALNGALGTRQMPAAVEQAMASSFDWRVHLPDNPSRMGLELVGARPCLYGEGRVAHIMYRHGSQPVSLFMLPDTARAEQLVEVLGHEAAIWCANNRTFVLVAREPRQEVERIASFVQASLH